jgi:hypothetical protein
MIIADFVTKADLAPAVKDVLAAIKDLQGG